MSLTFRSDITPISARHVFGPDTANAIYVAKAASYIPESGKTVVELRALYGEERIAEIQRQIGERATRDHLRRLFVSTGR